MSMNEPGSEATDASVLPTSAAEHPSDSVPPRHGPPMKRRGRVLTALGATFVVAVSGVVGYAFGHGHDASSAAARVAVFPGSLGSAPGTLSPGSSGQNSGGIDGNSVAGTLDKSIVNITTTLSGGEAAGTGIVISPSGLVLTNNHVIADSTSLQVENSADGSTHSATVLGYDVADDVALVQIQNVSGLTAAPLGDSSSLSVGDAVVALGNAGGKGGAPSVVTGAITALNQQITASDQDGSNAETLHNLIETDANIQPGDSGGPLTDSNGQVVGMDAAASSDNGGAGFAGQATNQGYAIPIQDALAIAKKIASGQSSSTIHVGPDRGVLGIDVQADATNGSGSGVDNGQTAGAVVSGVQSGSAAEAAGIAQGDVITAVDGTDVASASDLTHAMSAHSPHDTVTVTWTDSSGTNHQSSVQLGSGPPA
jgi:S1-C subfamily serine protease